MTDETSSGFSIGRNHIMESAKDSDHGIGALQLDDDSDVHNRADSQGMTRFSSRDAKLMRRSVQSYQPSIEQSSMLETTSTSKISRQSTKRQRFLPVDLFDRPQAGGYGSGTMYLDGQPLALPASERTVASSQEETSTVASSKSSKMKKNQRSQSGTGVSTERDTKVDSTCADTDDSRVPPVPDSASSRRGKQRKKNKTSGPGAGHGEDLNSGTYVADANSTEHSKTHGTGSVNSKNKNKKKKKTATTKHPRAVVEQTVDDWETRSLDTILGDSDALEGGVMTLRKLRELQQRRQSRIDFKSGDGGGGVGDRESSTYLAGHPVFDPTSFQRSAKNDLALSGVTAGTELSGATNDHEFHAASAFSEVGSSQTSKKRGKQKSMGKAEGKKRTESSSHEHTKGGASGTKPSAGGSKQTARNTNIWRVPRSAQNVATPRWEKDAREATKARDLASVKAIFAELDHPASFGESRTKAGGSSAQSSVAVDLDDFTPVLHSKGKDPKASAQRAAKAFIQRQNTAPPAERGYDGQSHFGNLQDSEGNGSASDER